MATNASDEYYPTAALWMNSHVKVPGIPGNISDTLLLYLLSTPWSNFTTINVMFFGCACYGAYPYVWADVTISGVNSPFSSITKFANAVDAGYFCEDAGSALARNRSSMLPSSQSKWNKVA